MLPGRDKYHSHPIETKHTHACMNTRVYEDRDGGDEKEEEDG